MYPSGKDRPHVVYFEHCIRHFFPKVVNDTAETMSVEIKTH